MSSSEPDRLLGMDEMLDAIRLDNLRGQAFAAVTVWKDGGSKIWSQTDAKYAEADEEWLTTINLPVMLDECPRRPPEPSFVDRDASRCRAYRELVKKAGVHD